MRAAYSYSLFGLVIGISTSVVLTACASDNGISGGDAGEDSGAGGKHTGTGGRTSTGGSTSMAGASGGGGAAGAAVSATCAMAVATECDGPEDCASGQHCCGEYNMGGYDKFKCMASCTATDAGAGAGVGTMGPLLFELCHPGDTCQDSTTMCLTSPYLPESLSRCYTSGNPPDTSLGKGAHEVNCGKSVCGSDEECCVRQPLEPYCAPKGTACACTHETSPEAGTKDGGATVKDGGGSVPDARAPNDATPAHD